MSTINGADALLVFAAIFWGAMIAAAGRHNLFDTAAALGGPSGGRARCRLILAVIFLNLLPLLYVGSTYLLVENTRGLRALISAAIVSFGIFGFWRMLAAFIRPASDQRQPWAHFVGGLLYMTALPAGVLFMCLTRCNAWWSQ